MLDISEVVVQGTPTYRGRVPCLQGLVSCVQFSSRVPPGSPCNCRSVVVTDGIHPANLLDNTSRWSLTHFQTVQQTIGELKQRRVDSQVVMW